MVKTKTDVFTDVQAAGYPSAATMQGGTHDGWTVRYVGAVATPALLEALDLQSKRWTCHDKGTRLAANPDHLQSLHADAADRLVLVLVTNTVDDETYVHLFGYNDDESFEKGLSTQRVTLDATHPSERPDEQ